MKLEDYIKNRISIINIYSKKNNIKLQKENIYKGYKIIKGTSEQINIAMENMDFSDWNINEYLIIQNTDDDSEKEMRFDGEKFISLKLPSSRYIKAKNSLQRCALDILNNPDITIDAILGGYGSGKTYLSMQMALYNVQEKGRASKILGVREVSGEGKEIGYLPGDIEDKVGKFFEPLTQSLNGGEFELQSLKMSGVLDTNVPFFMKGTTYNDTIVLCDEAEDLTQSQIRLIGTRLGENSKIYLAGDYKQSLLNKTINNPLIKMCNEFKGNEKFGCIYLGEDVRSETSKMFADLFEKHIITLSCLPDSFLYLRYLSRNCSDGTISTSSFCSASALPSSSTASCAGRSSIKPPSTVLPADWPGPFTCANAPSSSSCNDWRMGKG